MNGASPYVAGFAVAFTVVWLGLCWATAALAKKQGRNPAGWGILALILTPFLVILLLLLLGESTSKAVRQTAGRRQEVVKVRCSGCGSAVDESATYCPDCGRELEPAQA
jgi:hypothetical protein